MLAANARQRVDLAGFSALEFVIVIAIMAAIMGMGLYWLSGARYSSKLTTSARNLAAIGQMLSNYRSDHRGQLPILRGEAIPSEGSNYGMNHFTSDDPTTQQNLGDKLFPRYCSDPTLFYCPLSSVKYASELWYKNSEGIWVVPANVSWSYTYLGAHYAEGHIDREVVKGRVLAQTCSVYGRYNRTGEGTFDRETVILYDDQSVAIEGKFRW